jgi:nicotinate phosphoribosyltransferase
MERPRERLPPETFSLPAEDIRAGLYSDKYFTRARDVLLAEGERPRVTMQVFQKKHALLCGVDEAISILKLCLTTGFDWGDVSLRALRDGDRAEPWETVMHIEGPYTAFAHLETVYLGALARGTRVATNTRRVVEAAEPKSVLFFPARHDHWRLQQVDGYAAHVAGATGISTDAQGSWWGGTGMGTVPHALIAAYGGDTVRAARAFARQIPQSVPMIVLVDFENDSVATSLAVARALGSRLYGVRLDTSETLVDRSVIPEMGSFDPRGVNPVLVHKVRDALNREGFRDVRIVVSGGFDADKIRRFEEAEAPVDSYGVGSSLLREPYDFTADVVRYEGRPCGKVGRDFRPNPRLEEVV